ncbi:MAG: hypothetical protein MI924_29095 [Chloroflexales bacterium]|nr:hypothetical protein [Chloroflexales bacterium]
MLIIVMLEPVFQSRVLTIALMVIGLILAIISLAASEMNEPSRSLQSASVSATLLLRAEAIIASVVAAWLLGRDSLPFVNGWQATLLWFLALGIAVVWLQRREHTINDNTAGLIERSDHTHTVIKGSSSVLSIPKFSTIVAHLPLYELSTEVDVHDIDTQYGHKVKGIRVRVHYNIDDPEKLHNDAPNHYQMIGKLLKEQNKQQDTAVMEPGFWSQYLEKQIHGATDDVVRECIWDNNKNALEVSKERHAFAAEAKKHLSVQVQSWGIAVKELKFETVEIDPDTEKSIKRKDPERPERELKEADHEAKKESLKIQRRIEVEAEVENQRLMNLISGLKEQGVSSEIIEQFIFAAVKDHFKTRWGDDEANRRFAEIAIVTQSSDNKA